MALGIVVTYAFGSFLPWDDLAYFCSAFSVLLFSAMITMPRLDHLHLLQDSSVCKKL